MILDSLESQELDILNVFYDLSKYGNPDEGLRKLLSTSKLYKLVTNTTIPLFLCRKII